MLFGIGSEPVYNQNFLKTKTRSAGNEVTNFYGEKFSKVDSNHTCLAVISSHKRSQLLSRSVFKKV